MITVEIVHGHAFVSSDDIRNARNAAAKVLQEAGISAEIAYEEFCDQYEADKMTGFAAVWQNAESAANLALTAGWHMENGANCVIYV
jgi:hypothetical protein